RRCPESDVLQFSQEMEGCNNNVPDPTTTTQTFVPILPPPSTTTTKTAAVASPPTTDTTPTSLPTQTATHNAPVPSPTNTSGSTGSEDGNPPIGISSSTPRGTAISTSGLHTMSSSPAPLSTDGTSAYTSSGISSAVMAAMPASPEPPVSSSSVTPLITSDSGSHETSPKVTITLSAVLGVFSLTTIVLAAVFCVRRRRRRRRGHVAAPIRLIETTQGVDQDSTWERKGEHEASTENIHLAAAGQCSSPTASTRVPSRPLSNHASDSDNGRVISLTTTPQSPQSDTGGSARPLLPRIVCDSPRDTTPAIGEEMPSLRRASSIQHGSDMWSRDGVVGETTQAHRETLDIGKLAGSGFRKRAAFMRGDVDKPSMVIDDGASSERRRRLSLPAIPTAQPLSPTPPPQLEGTTASSARLSMGASGTRFVPVMVLMEVREDAELEEHDQPPPYQPRS
ncbi:hypothetical protein TRAPUB_12226, partial [Trametes pubescens]